jgi:thymidylate synthase
MSNGKVKKDRTGIGTISIFGYDMRIDLSEGLSLLTTKYVHYPAVLHELLWFLMGGTDIKYLEDNNVRIWRQWPFKKYQEAPLDQLAATDFISDPGRVRRHFYMDEYVYAVKNVPGFAERHGRVGKVYGAQWVNWTWPRYVGDGSIDVVRALELAAADLPYPEYRIDGWNQIEMLMHTLRTNPDSRRMLVTAWNPPEMEDAALPCCHYAFQCYTSELSDDERLNLLDDDDKMNFIGRADVPMRELLDAVNAPKRKLSLKFNMRSCDLFLGGPFDIASYSILTHMICKQLNYIPDELIMSIGDAHLYLNSIDAAKLQLQREPYPDLSKLVLNDTVKNIFDYKYDDFDVEGYKYHPAIKVQVAV